MMTSASSLTERTAWATMSSSLRAGMITENRGGATAFQSPQWSRVRAEAGRARTENATATAPEVSLA
jgi:hypothetical protein